MNKQELIKQLKEIKERPQFLVDVDYVIEKLEEMQEDEF